MSAILANPLTPLILATLVLPITIWSGWTGFRMSLHTPIVYTESETET